MNSVIGYARISSNPKKGYSIGEQCDIMIEKAKENGDDLKKEDIFIDNGYSGTNLSRPKIQEVLQLIGKGKIKKIYIICSDRLVRNKAYKDSLTKVFKKYGVVIISILDNWAINSNTPEDEFTVDVKALVDELEAKKVSPRTIRGLVGSAKQGNYTIGNIPPRGYRRIPNKKLGKGSYLEPIPEYVKYIRFIFLSLSEKRYNMYSIGKLFNKNKVMNLKWSEKEIEKIIRNHIYYGRLLCSYCDIENHTIPIITKEEFDAC